jgi:hypothetical protein
MGMSFGACSKRSEDCKSNETCESTGGTSGSTSVGGSETGGSNEGGNSTGGTSGGESSAGGTTSIPCNGACAGSAPFCNALTNKCVECISKTDCKDALKPVCSPTNVCVGCVTGADCLTDPLKLVCDGETSTCVGCLSSVNCGADPSKRVCNVSAKSCVSCLANTDCPTANASRCDTGTNTCAACQVDADCSQVDGKHVCDAGVCVQCTGAKYANCGQAEGKALVCNSLSKTCSTTATAQSAGLCKSCVSDAQCPAGQLCYQETFGGNPVGYFCFWKQGDTANGAPADCTIQVNRPYVNAQSNALSIDGEVATLCAPRGVTTCTALNQYSSTNCAPTGTPNEALCGFSPGQDAKCLPFGASQYLCTNTCLSDLDCKFGVTCNTNVNPQVCNLQ